ncbi:MAG: hypothetical protein MUC97_07615, partial [Bernardetiaceae bacterium]|nr:hypothetical protein [Bernardetiaceae bacterium]
MLRPVPFRFDAKALLVLSDADMVASAYADGQLRTEPGVDDQLTVVNWQPGAPTLRQLPVPNSVTNWVNGLAISPDGQTAFVVDTR